MTAVEFFLGIQMFLVPFILALVLVDAIYNVLYRYIRPFRIWMDSIFRW